LSFLGFVCWGTVVSLGFLEGTLSWDLPGQFVSFVIILGFAFLVLIKEYEKSA
jgi:hypothetical protein